MYSIETYIEDQSGVIDAEIQSDPGEVESVIQEEAGETSADLEDDKTTIQAQCGCDRVSTALMASDGVLYDGNSQPLFTTEKWES